MAQAQTLLNVPEKASSILLSSSPGELTKPGQEREFRNSLKGQHITIPNLYSLLPEWKVKLHPQYERARDEVFNPWIRRYVRPTYMENFK